MLKQKGVGGLRKKGERIEEGSVVYTPCMIPSDKMG